jgi:hypothetical protein
MFWREGARAEHLRHERVEQRKQAVAAGRRDPLVRGAPDCIGGLRDDRLLVRYRDERRRRSQAAYADHVRDFDAGPRSRAVFGRHL